MITLARLSLVTSVATWLLMILGSVVHGTGSSLACPDWPLCHGEVFPTMRGGVLFEHGHRLLALAVALLSVAQLAIARRDGDRVARRLAAIAVGLVAIQASLGAMTVLLRLPPSVSTAHLATSMAFLSVEVTLAVRALAPADATRALRSRAGFLGIAAAVAFGQIVLGAVVRHTGAAYVCVDLPLCVGQAWPDASLLRIHMAHRILALLVTCAVAGAAVLALRATRSVPSIHALAWVPLALLSAQIALGVAVVLRHASLETVTAHHAVGAALLGSVVALFAIATRGVPDAAASAWRA